LTPDEKKHFLGDSSLQRIGKHSTDIQGGLIE